MSEVQQYREAAEELEEQSRILQQRALAFRTRAAALEEQLNPLEVWRVRFYVTGTVQMNIHAPNADSAHDIARRWATETEHALDTAQYMIELLDDDLPERWSVSSHDVLSSDHVITGAERLEEE